MYEATKLLSSSSFPTQGDLRLTFLGMLAHLQHYKQQPDQYNVVADAIHDKLEVYWNRHLSKSSSISAILDPRYKITTFNNLEERSECIDDLKNLFSSYKTNSHIMPNRTSEETFQNSSRNYFFNMINQQSYSSPADNEFNEIDNYLNSSNDFNTDPLLWWKEHQNKYPILSSIAKDYLIIQATSVAAEQAFSIAGNTITPTRNKLDSETAREILCLKSWIENGMGITNTYDETGEISETNSNGTNSDSNYSDDDNNHNNSDINSDINSDTNSDTDSD